MFYLDVLSCYSLSFYDQFLQFLESLSKTLSMDSVTSDMGIDGATVAILARAEQVMKNESSNLVDRKTQIYNLQRQIKTLKEQADSKVRVHTDTKLKLIGISCGMISFIEARL